MTRKISACCLPNLLGPWYSSACHFCRLIQMHTNWHLIPTTWISNILNYVNALNGIFLRSNMPVLISTWPTFLPNHYLMLCFTVTSNSSWDMSPPSTTPTLPIKLIPSPHSTTDTNLCHDYTLLAQLVNSIIFLFPVFYSFYHIIFVCFTHPSMLPKLHCGGYST